MKFKAAVFSLICIFLTISGCSSIRTKKNDTRKTVMKTVYTQEAIKIDGVLDEQIWKQAPVYSMFLSRYRTKAGKKLEETGKKLEKAAKKLEKAVKELEEVGKVRFAWDDEYFYLAADFEDSDIIAQGQEDEMHHYRYGDLCELFLKPSNQTYYWELYVTPAGKKSSFFWPARSYIGLPDCLEKYSSGLKVAAQCNGTLNNWQDGDTNWTAEMAMPIKDLEAFGQKFDPGQNWTIFIGRYNYSRYLKRIEYSMSPQLSQTNYHLYEEYAELELVK